MYPWPTQIYLGCMESTTSQRSHLWLWKTWSAGSQWLQRSQALAVDHWNFVDLRSYSTNIPTTHQELKKSNIYIKSLYIILQYITYMYCMIFWPFGICDAEFTAIFTMDQKKRHTSTQSFVHLGSMGLVYLPHWNVGKYTLGLPPPSNSHHQDHYFFSRESL